MSRDEHEKEDFELSNVTQLLQTPLENLVAVVAKEHVQLRKKKTLWKMGQFQPTASLTVLSF